MKRHNIIKKTFKLENYTPFGSGEHSIILDSQQKDSLPFEVSNHITFARATGWKPSREYDWEDSDLQEPSIEANEFLVSKGYTTATIYTNTSGTYIGIMSNSLKEINELKLLLEIKNKQRENPARRKKMKHKTVSPEKKKEKYKTEIYSLKKDRKNYEKNRKAVGSKLHSGLQSVARAAGRAAGKTGSIIKTGFKRGIYQVNFNLEKNKYYERLDEAIKYNNKSMIDFWIDKIQKLHDSYKLPNPLNRIKFVNPVTHRHFYLILSPNKRFWTWAGGVPRQLVENIIMPAITGAKFKSKSYMSMAEGIIDAKKYNFEPVDINTNTGLVKYDMVQNPASELDEILTAVNSTRNFSKYPSSSVLKEKLIKYEAMGKIQFNEFHGRWEKTGRHSEHIEQRLSNNRNENRSRNPIPVRTRHDVSRQEIAANTKGIDIDLPIDRNGNIPLSLIGGLDEFQYIKIVRGKPTIVTIKNNELTIWESKDKNVLIIMRAKQAAMSGNGKLNIQHELDNFKEFTWRNPETVTQGNLDLNSGDRIIYEGTALKLNYNSDKFDGKNRTHTHTFESSHLVATNSKRNMLLIMPTAINERGILS